MSFHHINTLIVRTALTSFSHLKIFIPVMTPTPHDQVQTTAFAMSLDRAHSARQSGSSTSSASIVQTTLSRPIRRSTLNVEPLTQIRFPKMREFSTQPERVSFSGGYTSCQSGEFFTRNLTDRERYEFHTTTLQTNRENRQAHSRPFNESNQICQRDCGSHVKAWESTSLNLRATQAVRHELRKTCHEERNACQCPPTGGESNCHPRRWRAGRALRRTEQ